MVVASLFRPAGDAPRLSADGEVDRRYRRYAVCGLRHPPDYLALTGMLFPTRLFPVESISGEAAAVSVFRQTGHFHNRLVINNTAIAHRFGNLHQSLVFSFMPCCTPSLGCLSPYLLQAMFPPASLRNPPCCGIALCHPYKSTEYLRHPRLDIAEGYQYGDLLSAHLLQH